TLCPCPNPAMREANALPYLAKLRHLESSVAIDVYMSETAQECHLLLPEAASHERAEVRQGLWLAPQALICAPALPPMGESKPLYEIVRGLAERMGYGEYFQWQSWQDWARTVTAGLPGGLSALEERGAW